jgi:hypothetical protein
LAGLNPNLICFALIILVLKLFPPLENALWEIDCQGDASILPPLKIRTMDTTYCWSTENKGKRSAFILGENV